MKKIIVAFILASGVTAIAFAAFDSSSASNKKMKTEKKSETKKKKECKRSCMYSIWSPAKKPSVSQKAFLLAPFRIIIFRIFWKFKNYFNAFSGTIPVLLSMTWFGLYGKKPVFQPFTFQPSKRFYRPDLIFCQKKFLPAGAWWCQNKTPKFDLLTLLKI